MSKSIVGREEGGKYEVLGIDWSEKHMGIPTWGWAGGIAAALYFFFKKKR